MNVSNWVLSLSFIAFATAVVWNAWVTWRYLRRQQKEILAIMTCQLALEHRLAVFTGRPDLFRYNTDLFPAPQERDDKPTVN